jgi:hypothetical protein
MLSNERTSKQTEGPFQKMKSSFNEIFGKPETPPMVVKGAGKETAGKDR